MVNGIDSFHPDEITAQRASEMADEAVIYVWKQYQLKWDFSDASIDLVGAIVENLHESRESLLQLTESEARLSELVGAYLGEVLRRNHDWQWGTYEFLGARTMAVTQPEQIWGQAKVCPANWVRGRMLDGSDQPFATEFRQLITREARREFSEVVELDRTALAQLLEAACDPTRRYAIVSNKYYGWYAGHLPGGEQVLILSGRGDDWWVHRFDAQGVLTGITRSNPKLVEPPEEPYLQINDVELHTWLRSELGFEPGLIRIRQFEHPDGCAEIQPLTDRYREFLEDPDAVPRDEWAELLYATRQWVTRGEFVLLYNNDYWLDARGEVTSS